MDWRTFVDIEFASTNQLLKELLGRSTFQGIIVKSRREFTGIEGNFPNQIEFEVAASNIPPGHAADILGGISDSMKEHIDEIEDDESDEWKKGFGDDEFGDDDNDD